MKKSDNNTVDPADNPISNSSRMASEEVDVLVEQLDKVDDI
jgi:hypothetical protein